MRFEDEGSDQRTLWCGNISDQVSDEILYELFLQAGPLESVRRPRDPSGRPKSFAFILYKHECSVPYAVELFRGEKLFNRALNLSSHSSQHHIPVLDTHVTEFTERMEDKPWHKEESRNQRNDKRCSGREKDLNEPTSWAELNALRGKGSLINGHSTTNRDDLIGVQSHRRESRAQDNPPFIQDFSQLLQMSQHLMLPGILPGMPSMPGSPQTLMSSMGPMGPIGPMGPMGPIGPMGPMGPMGLMSPMGPIVYPSMKGDKSGGKRHSPDRERRRNDQREDKGRMGPTGPMDLMSPMGPIVYPSMKGDMRGKRHSPDKERRRNDYREERGSRRDHPYQDKRQDRSHYNNRRFSDNNYDHRQHDRGYSSSRSSHERERRDRRSR